MEKIAWVTGATSGIGYATAKKLAAQGYHLIVSGRRADRLENLKTEITDHFSVQVLPLCFDIRDRNEVERAVNELPTEWKAIDVLVNNAGLASGLAPIQSGDIEDWEKMIDTNIKGLLYITRMVANLMIPRKTGQIVNIGSIAGTQTYADGNVYCASKHAVNALSEGMRIDLLAHNIKVIQVRPGMVDTEFSTVRFHGDTERAANVYQGVKPLSGEDIADVIGWIVELPAHVNINDIVVTPIQQANAYYTYRHA